jgi:hypothetical protein
MGVPSNVRTRIIARAFLGIILSVFLSESGEVLAADPTSSPSPAPTYEDDTQVKVSSGIWIALGCVGVLCIIPLLLITVHNHSTVEVEKLIATEKEREKHMAEQAKKGFTTGNNKVAPAPTPEIQMGENRLQGVLPV